MSLDREPQRVEPMNDEERALAFGLTVLPRVFALAILAIGVATLVGWMSGDQLLLDPFGTAHRTQLNGALLLTAAGIALYSLTYGARVIALAAGLLSGFVAGAELVSHVLAADSPLGWLTVPLAAPSLQLASRQMPPNVALAYFLGAGAVTVARRSAFASAILASATATLGLAAAMGYATGVPEAFAWGDRTPMSLVQALGTLLYGIGIVVAMLRWHPLGLRAWTRWAPILAALVVTLVGILFWQALHVGGLQQSLRQTDATAYGVAHELEASVASVTTTLQALAWNSLDRRELSADVWVTESALAMAGSRGFEAIELVNADFERTNVAINPEAARSVATDVAIDAAYAAQLLAMRRDKRAIAVLPFHFFDTAPGIRVVIRIGSQADERGYVAGVLDSTTVFTDAADQTAVDYMLELSCDGALLFPRDETDLELTKHAWRREVRLGLPAPGEWRLAATPRAEFLAAQNGGLAQLLLVSSLAIAGLLSVALRFAGLATSRATGLEADVRAQTSALRDALVSLRTENAQRRRSEATLERALAMTVLVSGERDIESVVQAVTDVATELTGAAWGAFFYSTTAASESGARYTLSGASREDFAGLPLPRATPLIGPSLRGEAVVRVGDVRTDPRYGRNPPFHGMPDGHPLDVVSYMSVPVRSRSGPVWGAILLGHPEPGTFTLRDEEIAVAMAAEASIALDHARAHAVETELAAEARSANAAKDRFLATLSHELRNPLGSLRTALDVLDRAETTSANRQHMRAIARRQVEHLTRMVDDLLDVSRIEGGKLGLSLKRIDLVGIVREVADAEASRIAEHGLELDLEIDPRPVWIDADPTRMAQVIGNLLGNAVKFTPRGGRIAFYVTSDPVAEQAIVCVADTGSGIASKDLPRVFEPFVQGEQSIDREAGGLGLGLAVVKGFVVAHGGTIEAHSQGPGQGAAFVLRLPLREAPAAPHVRVAPIARARSLKVLIIDDHRDSVEGLVTLLEQCGHTVRTAFDGKGGVEAAKTEPPDLVICDIGLPAMDGYEVARALREDGTTSGVALFALSGYGSTDAIRRAREAGFDRHLVKPVDPAALIDLLATVCEPSCAPPP